MQGENPDSALPGLGVWQEQPVAPSPLCGRCIATPPLFDATHTLADYAAPLDSLALSLKFRSRLAVARLFAEELAKQAGCISSGSLRPDLVIPIPLSGRRLVARGYNQAWEIARPFARLLDIPAHATLLARPVDTREQARLTAPVRARNIYRAFVISPAVGKTSRKPLQGLHIAVVDDVMTSGPTLNAAARVLKHAGAVRVTNFVALRTPLQHTQRPATCRKRQTLRKSGEAPCYPYMAPAHQNLHTRYPARLKVAMVSRLPGRAIHSSGHLV